MMKYQINSKRKHFYTCKICSFVYISADALKSHYTAVHPGLPCDVEEIQPELNLDEEEELDEYTKNMNNNFIYAPIKHEPQQQEIYTFTPLSTTNPTGLTSLPSASVVPTINTNFAFATYANPMIFTQPTSFAIKTINQHQQLLQAQPILVSNGDGVGGINVTAKKTHVKGRNSATYTNNPKESIPNNNNNDNNITNNSELIKCEVCMKKFSTIYNKKRHDEMFHKPEQNTALTTDNKCSVCDKSFTSIYNKKRHEATHKPLDERLKYKCQIDSCNKEYTTQSILKTHMKKVHGIDTILD